MMPDVLSRRRALLQALAGMTLVSASRLSFGQTGNDDAPKGSKGAAKTGKTAVLTVIVTGNGKPVAQAEVKVRFPPGVGGEETLPTDQAGEALFNSAGTGIATVRVIATGWESVLQEVALKQGPQRLTIKLNALPNAK